MPSRVEFSNAASTDMSVSLTVNVQRIVVKVAVQQLTYQPLEQTRNRKPLRPNPSYPIAFWELRIDTVRVFYEVEESANLVYIVAVGEKDHNEIRIRHELIPYSELVKWLAENRG